VASDERQYGIRKCRIGRRPDCLCGPRPVCEAIVGSRALRASTVAYHWVDTGLINGGTGVFTLPAVPYLQALGLSKDDLIQALGLSFTVSTIALAAGLARGGALRLGNITLSALAIIPALLGMQAGTTVRERISAATFRRWFLIVIAILGLELAVHPFLF
jgi:uncharacterized membrane protein YfcA